MARAVAVEGLADVQLPVRDAVHASAAGRIVGIVQDLPVALPQPEAVNADRASRTEGAIDDAIVVDVHRHDVGVIGDAHF